MRSEKMEQISEGLSFDDLCKDYISACKIKEGGWDGPVSLWNGKFWS